MTSAGGGAGAGASSEDCIFCGSKVVSINGPRGAIAALRVHHRRYCKPLARLLLLAQVRPRPKHQTLPCAALPSAALPPAALPSAALPLPSRLRRPPLRRTVRWEVAATAVMRKSGVTSWPDRDVRNFQILWSICQLCPQFCFGDQ